MEDNKEESEERATHGEEDNVESSDRFERRVRVRLVGLAALRDRTVFAKTFFCQPFY